MFTSNNLSGLTHGFLTRRGGVSSGLLGSLNLGLTKGDSVSNVKENRKRALERLGAESASLTICHQIHSNRVVVVDRPWKFGVESAPKADALVTTRPNIILGVLSADCVPILLADQISGVVGAAHAGWRGLQKGVIQEVVQVMCQQGANLNQIKAAIGPCVHKDCYEVGAEVRSAFVEDGLEADRYFSTLPKKQKYLCDLPGLAKYFLQQAGVTNVESVNQNTYNQEERFFSYRRATHREEPIYGSQLSAIGL